LNQNIVLPATSETLLEVMKHTISAGKSINELTLENSTICQFQLSTAMFLSILEVTSVKLPIVFGKINVQNSFVSTKILKVIVSGQCHVVGDDLCLDGDLLRLALLQEVPELPLTVVLSLVKFSFVDNFSLVSDDSAKSVEFTIFDRSNVPQVVIDSDGVVLLEVEVCLSDTGYSDSVIESCIFSRALVS
jgi:hypothetical protein